MGSIIKNMKKTINNLISYSFYAYFAIIPLLAVLLFYFTGDLWTKFSSFSGIYKAFTLSAIFLSGIFALAIILKTPLPKNKWILVYTIFITPISIFLNYLLGQDINIATIVIFDFLLQILAYIIADIALLSINKKLFKEINKEEGKILLDFFGIALIFSFYGYITFLWIETADLKTNLIYLFSLISTSYAFYKVFTFGSQNMTKNEQKIQKDMNKFGVRILMASSIFIAFLFIKIIYCTKSFSTFNSLISFVHKIIVLQIKSSDELLIN